MAITKESIVTAWPFGPAIEIIKVSRKGPDRGWFEKHASILTEERASLRPMKGHTPVYMIPMGAMEIVGFNRNADGWPGGAGDYPIHSPAPGNLKVAHITAGLRERHPTFVTHAKIFRNHNNKDARLSSGVIHSSAYNEPMGRVEVISFVKNAEWEDDLNKLANGKLTGISMSSKVPLDICSNCGNVARNRHEYCDCIRMHKNAILEDGHQIGMINEQPTFFDLSGVRANADRIGYSLARLATAQEAPEMKEAALTSESALQRAALLRKLAEIEKDLSEQQPNAQIMELARSVDPRLEQKVPDATITIIRSYRAPNALKEMSRRSILLPPKPFFRLMGGDALPKIEPMLPRIESMLPGVFRSLCDSDDLSSIGEPEGAALRELPRLSELVSELEPAFSMKPRHARGRIAISISRFGTPPKKKQQDEKETKKEASATPAGRLAREYGKYVLGALSAHPEPRNLHMAVLSNLLERS